MHDARRTIAAWREDYNHVRLHSSLGGLAPGMFNKGWMAANGKGVVQPQASGQSF
jgi:putative transposase